MKTRTPERIQFLANLLVTAIENSGYGSFAVSEWHCPDDQEETWYAEVEFPDADDEGKTAHRVDLDTMAKGLGIIRSANTVDEEGYLLNAAGKQLGFGGEPRKELLLADRTNGEDGDYDVIGGLAVLECAIFGRVIYA